LNARFDEWAGAKQGEPIPGAVRYGSVDWLFREFKASIRYREKVSQRSRPDYERCMLAVADMVTNQGDRVGTGWSNLLPLLLLTKSTSDCAKAHVASG
jgi:hypothetical protein